MLRRVQRALTAGAVVASAAAVLSIAPATSAGASPNCGGYTGSSFDGTVSDTLAPGAYRMWETSLVGAAEVAFAASRSVQFTVWADRDGSCETICYANSARDLECTATGVGTLVITVGNPSATLPVSYTLSERTPFFSGPMCDDDRDNDRDGATDAPADGGCTSETDPLEGDATGCVDAVAGDGCYVLSQGAVLTGADLVAPDAGIGTGQYVRGYLDVYRFPVAAGASVTVPCVVLTATSTVNPCSTAGGTFVSRTATLVDRTLPKPSVTVQPLASINVCDGRLTLTVAGYGAENFPIVTPC